MSLSSRQKKIAVLGAGRSGLAAAQLAAANGINVLVSDRNKSTDGF
jgi:UDP-N-acetylmuramoylalanine-D-glutamate ligase